MTAAQLPWGLADIARQTAWAAKPLPPVEKWDPPHCGDSAMRIARDGTWFHDGAPIIRRDLARLFSTLLRKDADGFVLVTPAEKLSIVVEDAPFLAVAMQVSGEGERQRLTFVTNMDDAVVAGPDHSLRFEMRDGAPIPYLHVRAKLEAKLSRALYYRLIDLAAKQAGMLGVWSDGVFFPLGDA